jgi:hypothetical protein
MARVVFILGAGASRPYGLPSSTELRDILLGGEAGDKALVSLGIDINRIISFLDSRGKGGNEKYNSLYALAASRTPPVWDVARLFLDAAFESGTTDPLLNFRTRLFCSQRVSIDAFITRNPDLEKIAQYAVAAVLLLCEREEYLEAGWYQQFLERLMRDGSRDGEFGVITFNYDRSFERYFTRAFTHNYLTDPQLALKLFGRIKIIHVYGSLGTLAGNTTPPLVKYGDVNNFGNAIDQFHLATPEHAPNSEITNLLDGVERVVFVGFGFWKENLGRIELDKETSAKVYASAFRLPATVRESVKGKYPRIVFGNRDDQVLDFVLNHPVFV